jgi:hypothetical protein
VYVWNTNSVPDGPYRLRVTASDLEGNAVGEEREAWAVSPVITVDNTAPRLESFEASGGAGRISVRGAAVDSPGLRFEIAVDDGEWRAVAPEGGFADEERASFAATIQDLAPGVHSVSVRAIDRAGNFAVRAARATVTR